MVVFGEIDGKSRFAVTVVHTEYATRVRFGPGDLRTHSGGVWESGGLAAEVLGSRSRIDRFGLDARTMTRARYTLRIAQGGPDSPAHLQAFRV